MIACSGVLGLQDFAQPLRLVAGGDLHVRLLDRVHRELLGGNADRDRVVHMALGELRNRRGHRRREKPCLPTRRAHPQDLLDVLDEPQVEHLVGLVEDDEANRGQHQDVARDQVHHAPDRGHHHLRPGAKAGRLLRDRLAAEHGDDLDVHVLGVRAERLRDLDAELRVGVITIACSSAESGSRYWSSGGPNAAVLPVPVCAWPITS